MLEKEQSLHPKMTFQVTIDYPLSNKELEILTILYQPIIGADALSLYLTLLSEINQKGSSEKLFHADLIMMMDKSIQAILTARKKLEGIGLLDTYYTNDSDLGGGYLYQLLPPESIERFFKDEVLTIMLFNSVGERKLDKLYQQFKTTTIDYTGFKKVNASFQEVYSFKESQIISYREKLETIRKGIRPPRKKKQLSETTETFDWAYFSQEVKRLGLNFPKDEKSFKEEIFVFHNLYGINEIEMVDFCSKSFDYYTNQIVEKEFRRSIYDIYDRNKPQITADFKETEHVKEQEKQTYRYNSLKMNGFSEQDIQVIMDSERHFPLNYLDALKEERGGYTTPQERSLIKYLVEKSGLPNSVINILINYVYNIQNQPTLKSEYMNRIANQWAQLEIFSPEKAIEHVRELAKKSKQKKQSGYYPNNKKIIRQEKLPEWVNQPTEAAELSPEEHDKINQEIQKFLNKGGVQ